MMIKKRRCTNCLQIQFFFRLKQIRKSKLVVYLIKHICIQYNIDSFRRLCQTSHRFRIIFHCIGIIICKNIWFWAFHIVPPFICFFQFLSFILVISNFYYNISLWHFSVNYKLPFPLFLYIFYKFEHCFMVLLPSKNLTLEISNVTI